MLILANNSVIPYHETPETDINRIANRVIDELVCSVREFHLDEVEAVSLKTIVFFDPGVLHFSSCVSPMCVNELASSAFVLVNGHVR